MKRVSSVLTLAVACALYAVVAPAADATLRVAAPHHFFSTPSGNIGCYVDRSYARCDIRKRTWRAPPKPASCHLDWGNGLEVTRRARFVCAGDTVAGSPHVLRYGHSVQFGNKRCTSRRVGVVCRNLDTGHGFRLARTSYRRF